jgi:MFS family permease
VPAPAATTLPIARNTALLSSSLAMNSATLQLGAAVGSLTLVRVVHVEGLLGLGPAIMLAAGALAALPAGLLMDRMGRVPVLAGGFSCGIAGCLLAALGSAQGWAVAVLLGLILVGTASSTALLARTAAADMYPPERRARGIALVLFGSVFGAILGPAVFSPLLAGRDLDGDALATLWIAAAGFMVAGLAIVLTVRPDPKQIAMLLADAGVREGGATPPPASLAGGTPLHELIRRPGVIPALVAAQASFAVMVMIMTLTGAIVVDHHHHAADNVFPIIGAHVIGMFGLIIVVGDIVDAIGRTRALAAGLLLMALSAVSLLWITGVAASMGALFGLGLGWNFAFVAATAILSDCTAPAERGKLLGFNDLLAGLTGAGLALSGGVALTEIGVAALAIGGAAVVIVPALWILRADGLARAVA